MKTRFGQILIFCVGFLILIIGWLSVAFVRENSCPINECNYIAHGGGMINGYTYTNSKEAVEHSIQCGIKYIELDLVLTADSVLVATHSWKDYNKMVGNDDVATVPTLEQFKTSKLHGYLTPMTFSDIDSIMCAHPDIYLVTDKMSDPTVLEPYIAKYKDRTIVECLSLDDYYYYMDHGYKMSMYRNGLSLMKQLMLFVGRKLHGMTDRYSACVVYKGSQDKIRSNCKFVYTCNNRQEADSIFAHSSDVKFVYIDDVR